MADTTEANPQIVPFLWFNNNAEEAVEFYLSVFKSGKRVETTRGADGGPFQKDAVVTTVFELDGRRYIAFNGGPGFPFTEAISLSVMCKTQEEIDYYWSALTADGGKEVQCGWLKDKFGLCWQIVPANIGAIVKSPGAMKALMTMTKLDIAALEAAM
jgi:predicted 3-demethylubiquinone-9 3-methyltransferase (glyoxalase superfamily)